MKPYYRFKNYDLKKNGSLFIWLKGKYLFIYFIEVFIEKKNKANWKYNNNVNSKLKFFATYVALRQCDFYN